jgi:hypothetical protein
MTDTDKERIEHMKQILRHSDAHRRAAADDAGKADASRQAVKAAAEAARLSGIAAIRRKGGGK